MSYLNHKEVNIYYKYAMVFKLNNKVNILKCDLSPMVIIGY